MTSGDELLTRATSLAGAEVDGGSASAGTSSLLNNPLRTFFVFCALVVAMSLLFSPVRVLSNVLVWGNILTGLGLAGMFFVAIHDASNAGWATVIRRVPIAFASLVPLGSLLVVIAILGGGGRLYPWMAEGAHLEGFKGLWLSVPFFHIRAVIYIAAWVLFSRMMRNAQTADAAAVKRDWRRGAFFIVVFAFTVWLSSVDWIMSLEPFWYSTMFGVYRFAGLFCAGLAAITLTVILLRRRGAFGDSVSDEHLHDLGKLMFAFSTFWMYIWFSQYMLIWYSNISEEVTYFEFRGVEAWGNLMFLSVILNWGIPFLVLLSSRSKRNEKVLVRIAGILLVGHWLDLFIAILPPTNPEVPQIGAVEVAAAFLGVTTVVLIVSKALRSRPLLPSEHPHFSESLHHHV